jgi:hypothetical protein
VTPNDRRKLVIGRKGVVVVAFIFVFGYFLSPLLAAENDEEPKFRFGTLPNTGYGPLSLRSASPFQFLRLALLPEGPDTLDAGQWELRQTYTWANLWAFERDRYVIDAEILRSTISLRYGLTKRWQVGVELPALWRDGGFADSSIEDFHHTFGMGQGHRDEFPRNEFQVEVHAKDGGVFSLNSDDAGMGFQDAVLSSRVSITSGTARCPALSAAVHVKLPTGDNRELFGSEGVDWGISLSMSKRVGDFFAYLSVGYVYSNSDHLNGVIDLRRSQWTGLAALEYKPFKKTSFILQYLCNTGPAQNLYEFSKTTHELTFGIQWGIGKSTLIQIGVLENIFFYDNSPDIGLHLGTCLRF